MSKIKSQNGGSDSTVPKHDVNEGKDEERGLELPEFIRMALEYPNVWEQPSVSLVPEKWLDSWRIAKIVKVAANPEYYGYHFVGRNMAELNGAVSTKIERFDPRTMAGRTRSGRLYRLVGRPGHNHDAEYTLSYWLQANKVEAEDATAEFIQQYGISLENIDKLSK